MEYIQLTPQARQILAGKAKSIEKRTARNLRRIARPEGRPYEAFRGTEAWKNLRLECLALHMRRDHSFCWVCGRPVSNYHSLRVHHLRYPRNGEKTDPWHDMIPVCGKCHNYIHSDINVSLRHPELDKYTLRKEYRRLRQERKREIRRLYYPHQLIRTELKSIGEAQLVEQLITGPVPPKAQKHHKVGSPRDPDDA